MLAEAHPHLPSQDDPNNCRECDQTWASILHQPSLVLEVLRGSPAVSEDAGGPGGPLVIERASGAPFVAAASPPARQHKDDPVELRCPQCSETRLPVLLRHHLEFIHKWPRTKARHWVDERTGATDVKMDPAEVGIQRNGITTEVQQCRYDGTHLRHLWRPAENTEWFTCNGIAEFDPVTNTTHCPECQQAVPTSQLLLHMREVDASDQEDIDAMAELLGLPKLLPPDSLVPNIEKFLDPTVPTDDLIDKHEGMRAELTDWWVELAREEATRVVPKAVEYGALDLIQIGHDLAMTAGRAVTDEEAAELGVYFYIRGKLARWTDAVIRHDRVSDDTLHDLGVYVRMAQRIRAKGSWPGVDNV